MEIVERLAQRENSRVPLALLDGLRYLKHADAASCAGDSQAARG